MTNSHFIFLHIMYNINKNMTDGQFYLPNILTNGHFCAKLTSGNQNNVLIYNNTTYNVSI